MKTCIFDLETSSLSADRGVLYCAVLEEFGNPKTRKILRADEFPEWKKDRRCCKGIVTAVLQAMEGTEDEEGYDVFVAHNGQYFDKKMLTAWALKYGIRTNLRFEKFIDPVLLCRKHLRLERNSLANVIEFLNVPYKKTPVNFDHWMNVTFNASKESLDYIVEHCVADVIALGHVYAKVRKLVKGIDERGSAG